MCSGADGLASGLHPRAAPRPGPTCAAPPARCSTRRGRDGRRGRRRPRARRGRLVPRWPAHGWLLLLALTSQVLGWLLISSRCPVSRRAHLGHADHPARRLGAPRRGPARRGPACCSSSASAASSRASCPSRCGERRCPPEGWRAASALPPRLFFTMVRERKETVEQPGAASPPKHQVTIPAAAFRGAGFAAGDLVRVEAAGERGAESNVRRSTTWSTSYSGSLATGGEPCGAAPKRCATSGKRSSTGGGRRLPRPRRRLPRLRRCLRVREARRPRPARSCRSSPTRSCSQALGVGHHERYGGTRLLHGPRSTRSTSVDRRVAERARELLNRPSRR